MLEKFYRYLVLFYTLTIVTGITGIMLPVYLPYKEYYIWPFLVMGLWFFISNKIFDRALILPMAFSFFFYTSTLFLSIMDGTSGYLQYLVFFNVTIYSLVISEKNVFNYVLKQYLNLSKALMVVFILIFLADLLNLFSYQSLSLPRHFDQGFWNKYLIEGNTDVYGVFSGFFVIMKNYVKPIFILDSIGTYCGLSYEPHLYGFMISPAIFLLSRQPKGGLWLVLGLFTLFLAFSMTNIVAFIVAFFFLKGYNILKGLILSLTFISSNILYKYIVPLIYWFEAKSNSRSAEDIGDTSNFFLEAKSGFGGGIWSYLNSSSKDIGWFSVLMIGLIISFLLWKSISRLEKNGSGIAIAVYLLIHSAKFPVNVFFLPFLFFVVSILTVYNEGVLRGCYKSKG